MRSVQFCGGEANSIFPVRVSCGLSQQLVTPIHLGRDGRAARNVLDAVHCTAINSSISAKLNCAELNCATLNCDKLNCA